MNAARAKVVLPCALFANGLTGLFSVFGGRHLANGTLDIASPPVRLAVTSKTVTPARPTKKLRFLSGMAFWYGQVFYGRRTANGEIFSKDAMTNCYRTLPFGALVRVINLCNRKSVIVRINYRGVLTPRRIIDLSSAAAQKIGMLEAGITPVRLEIVTSGQSYSSLCRMRQPFLSGMLLQKKVLAGI